jgi:hypothetical protein
VESSPELLYPRNSKAAAAVLKLGLVLGLVVVVIIGAGVISYFVSHARNIHRIEGAVRASHPELSHVSCFVLNPLDSTLYNCSGRDGRWTTCLSVSGNVQHPVVDVRSHLMSVPGQRPSC